MLVAILCYLLGAVPNLDHRLLPTHHHPNGVCRWTAMGYHDGVTPPRSAP